MALTPYMKVFPITRRFLNPRNPFSQMLHFLSHTLKIDFTRLSFILTLFGLISAVFTPASRSIFQAYEWIQKFFMVSVCVPAPDELYEQVLTWVSAHVLKQRANRSLFAQTTIHRGNEMSPKDYAKFRGRRKVEIEYLPSFKSIWFLYERRPFIIKLSRNATIGVKLRTGRRRVRGRDEKDNSKVNLTVSSIGRSQEPIRRFLKECRGFSENQQQSTVAIHAFTMFSYMEYGWEVKAHRATRHLDSVHLDEDVKSDLVADIEQYLNPRTRQYYTSLNIPYRRGYLLYGPPGTGKTSLSVALAGEFGLDLFILDLSAVPNDEVLDQLFQELPSPCLVLLEDIDVVGLKDRNDDEEEKKAKKRFYMKCTLAGLLNALDGVASSEGRILLMTTNQPERLDEALLRPGRVDRKIYFGHVNQHGAEQMFRRMYEADLLEDPIERDSSIETLSSIQDGLFTSDIEDEDLASLAARFSKEIPRETFTPAQLQEYLLQHQRAPMRAVTLVAGFVAEEKRKIEEKEAKFREANGKGAKIR
ncbi:P-loop containing nucleoside triphosphate hydrolase protein [Annulohypoxylon maeteangense]|uniref:P-loop containing nucleoside triphosphate hydrolase protein n=1 Tax=Annulohypoxylon maeteangense TaxID=1927788 RepID=UPI00200883FA|nr:P-loop containing nucleoside triphosphate hydrolase protein [Annulohypoxylon maeteangense]KAI0880568.1 P-loop containing nucleoside triphosphate hydrolase protein [Annulohypoxylon maeteangense]